MKEKHGTSNETDITGVLVVVFVLMVGILIAKVAGDFTTRTTSTSTRAAQNMRPLSSFVTQCPDNQVITWWGLTIPCPIAKVDGSCPKTNPVDDNTSTSLNPKKDRQCHTLGSMDSYFNQQLIYATDGIGSWNIKRGTQYCKDQSGNKNAVCLMAWGKSYNIDCDASTGKPKSPYEGYIKYTKGVIFKSNVNCPIFFQSTQGFGPAVGFSDTVEKGTCYIPVPTPKPTNTP